MKLLNMILLSIFSFSCATDNPHHGLKDLEKVKNEYRAAFYLDDYKPQKQTRGPASVAVKTPQLSNRQVYFLSYYKQYLNLAQVLKVHSKITSCPSFHQVVLEYEKELKSFDNQLNLNVNLNSVKTDQSNLSYYPVLSMQGESDRMVYDELYRNNWKESQSTLRNALLTYHTSMQGEIEKLCDTGVSPGYYVYENLVTYFKEFKDFHHTRDGLKALLKVPTLANMVILDNLSQDSYYLARENVFDQWLLSRANTHWFKQYMNHIKSKRSQVLKSELAR